MAAKSLGMHRSIAVAAINAHHTIAHTYISRTIRVLDALRIELAAIAEDAKG